MRARQREVGQIVIELRRRPADRRMALRAGVRQVQRFMIRIIGTRIVCLMARPAIRRRVVELTVRMALRA